MKRKHPYRHRLPCEYDKDDGQDEAINKHSREWDIDHFHLAQAATLSVGSPQEDLYHGILATRVSNRPNPIGISMVELSGIEGFVLHVSRIDAVNGPPLALCSLFKPTDWSEHGLTGR